MADEIIDHLVALLGVRTARLYLGPNPAELTCVGRFGPQVLTDDELEHAWKSGVVRGDVVALPLKSTSGVLGLLVAANKEARAGTEPLADNDVRLLELFAIQVTVALEYARSKRRSLLVAALLLTLVSVLFYEPAILAPGALLLIISGLHITGSAEFTRREVATTVGAVAVVVSLLYLAVQIRQNTRLLRSAASQAAAYTAIQISSPIATDPRIAKLYRDAILGYIPRKTRCNEVRFALFHLPLPLKGRLASCAA